MKSPFIFESLPVTRWKNGGGETREIVKIDADDAPFLWRASLATLSADGPFSLFEGVDRVITLIAGEPLWLRGDGINHHLERWQPWAFAGELPLSSHGIRGEGMDFNIMTLRGRASAQVRVVNSSQTPGENGVAFVLRGNWQMADQIHQANGGLSWQNEQPGLLEPYSGDALLLLAEIIIH